MNQKSVFEEFESVAQQQGTLAAIDFLEHHYRDSRDHYGLFEVLKMKSRHNMGLPLTYGEAPDEIDETKRRELEDQLVECCREVGQLFFADGRIEEGWMYLQPVGDKPFIESLVRKTEITEENLNALIDISLHQGVAPGYGYELLLKHTGTCNGITAFDVQARQFDKATQIEMASLLLNHLYRDLLTNVHRHVAEETKQDVSEKSLGSLLDELDWLGRKGGHHTDATHLASAVRIARLVESPADIKNAIDLANYGSRLPEDFQYGSDPPFESTYKDHLIYFNALEAKTTSGVKVAVDHFSQKAAALEADGMGALGWEVLIDLLVRIDRRDDALDIAIDQLVGDPDSTGISPGVFEIPKTAAQFERLAGVFLEREELLGFAIGKLKAQTLKKS
jgi:hypothetical protein